MANAGLITFATQGESAGRSSSRRTDQEHEQGSGSGKQTRITMRIRIQGPRVVSYRQELETRRTGLVKREQG